MKAEVSVVEPTARRHRFSRSRGQKIVGVFRERVVARSGEVFMLRLISTRFISSMRKPARGWNSIARAPRKRSGADDALRNDAPHQIRTAIEHAGPSYCRWACSNITASICLSHGHARCRRILEILEKEMDLVILPPFTTALRATAVEPPEGNGTLHVDAEALLPFAKAMFQGCCASAFATFTSYPSSGGKFRRRHADDLAFRFAPVRRFSLFSRRIAARDVGSDKMADYYARQSVATIRSTGSRRIR